MFHADTDTGNSVIEELIGDAQFLAFGFLLRLECQDTQWLIALKSRIFDKRSVERILKRFLVSNFLVMRFSAIGLAEIIHTFSMRVRQNYVFVGMGFFFHYTFHVVFQRF